MQLYLYELDYDGCLTETSFEVEETEKMYSIDNKRRVPYLWKYQIRKAELPIQTKTCSGWYMFTDKPLTDENKKEWFRQIVYKEQRDVTNAQKVLDERTAFLDRVQGWASKVTGDH